MMKDKKSRPAAPVKGRPVNKPTNGKLTKDVSATAKPRSVNESRAKERLAKGSPSAKEKERPIKDKPSKSRPTNDKPLAKDAKKDRPNRPVKTTRPTTQKDRPIELREIVTVHTPMLDNNDNNNTKNGGKRTNEKTQNKNEDKLMLPKGSVKKGGDRRKSMNKTLEDDRNSGKARNKSCRKPNKRVLLICIVIFIVILVMSTIVAVLVWKFVIDTPNDVDMERESMIRIDIDIHLNRSYTPDHADQSTTAYRTLANIYISEINRVFEESRLSAIYLLTIVDHFSPGSVVVSSSSFFSIHAGGIPSNASYLRELRSDVEEQLLRDLVGNHVLGPLADVVNAVIVKQPTVVYTTPNEDEVDPNTSEEQPKVKQNEPIYADIVCGSRPGLRQRRKRIVGGAASPFGSMPWIGSVRKVPEGHYCAATLLNERWAVTAAQCLGGTDHVVFGDLFLDWPSDFHEDVNISAVFSHPGYNFTAERADKPNDMALIRLSRSVKISSAIRPACIARSTTELYDYRQCTAAGWGVSDYRSANTNRLQEVLLPLVPSNDCRTFYSDRDVTHTAHREWDASSVLSSPDDYDGISNNNDDDDDYESVTSYNTSLVSGSMICAGGYPEGGVGACLADSGGPLVCLGEDDVWYLVGITSWSWGCDLPNIPNVFARISAFQGFIDGTIMRTEECIKDDTQTQCFDGCVGGEDCLKQCQPGDFRCRAGYCIPGDKLCDDHVDCMDGSDEDDYANCLNDCGETMISADPDSTATIQSPGFPIEYPNFYRCQWQITSSAGGRLLINFTDFALEDDYDFLDVATGLQREDYLFSLTGSNPPLDILSPASKLVLTFATDVSTSKQGFYVRIDEITDVEEFRTCDNGVQLIPPDRNIFCDGVSNCADESDEINNCSTRRNEGICGKGTILISQESPANISYMDYANSAHCRWVVNADSPTSRLRVHFHSFDIESNYDELFISSSLHSDATKLIYTGHKLPPDIISPGASLVITFETDASGVDLGFLLQVSWLDPTDESFPDIVMCANNMEVIADAYLCDGLADCQDGSDEQPGCECGEPLLVIPPGGAITLTSYNYPQKYHRSILCQWTIKTESKRTIAIQFSDFSVEEDYDFLHIGTRQRPRMLTFTGSSLPLDVLLPAEEMVVVFETDNSISDRGFSIIVNDVGEITDKINFCENGLQVIPTGEKASNKCHD